MEGPSLWTVVTNGTTTWSNTANNQGRFRSGAASILSNQGTWQDQNAFSNQMSNDFGGLTSRFVNEGFSGGEKKRNEILQMMMLDPRYCILDETDSGLDIDALKIVAKGVNAMRSENRGILMITHYQRLLDYIKPDHVHVMAEGKIVRSGGPELALELEKDGYDFLKEAVTA